MKSGYLMLLLCVVAIAVIGSRPRSPSRDSGTPGSGLSAAYVVSNNVKVYSDGNAPWLAGASTLSAASAAADREHKVFCETERLPRTGIDALLETAGFVHGVGADLVRYAYNEPAHESNRMVFALGESGPVPLVSEYTPEGEGERPTRTFGQVASIEDRGQGRNCVLGVRERLDPPHDQQKAPR